MTARLLTVPEVCEFLQTDETNVKKLYRSGTLKGITLPDGTVRIAPASLGAFANSAETARPSPYLNAQQAADYLGIALRTLYNNRRHIPALPGFRTLMFDPVELDRVRASQTFRTKRLKEQRRQRAA